MKNSINPKRSLVHTFRTQPFAGEIVFNKEKGMKEIKLFAPKLYKHAIDSKFGIGDRITLSLTNRRPKRTEQQNRYYWLYMTIISDETGHTPEEIHEWVKGKFVTKEIKQIFGVPVRIKGSTTDMSVTEFSDLITRIAAETHIEPPPIDFDIAKLK